VSFLKKHREFLIALTFILIFSMIIKYINFEIPANICISRIQNSIPVIILDAGHGGYDPGAVSGDILEKNINLAISQKLNDVLVCLGFKTIMTRNNDLALNDKGVNNKKQSDLNNRLEIINSEQDAILISVHQNMFSESKYRGSQVFYNSIPGSVEFAELLQKNIVNLLQKDNHRVSKSGDYLYLLNKSKQKNDS
jgi:N-acetylmuramoyl-L-alanine amidase